jgi:hypothetical protein
MKVILVKNEAGESTLSHVSLFMSCVKGWRGVDMADEDVDGLE